MLVVLMLAGMILPVQAAAAPAVTLTSGEAKSGESILLTVSIEDNPGLATYQLYFYYDTSVFELEKLSAAGSFNQSGGILTNSIAVADARGRYDGQSGKDGTLGLWYNSLGINESGSGEMAKIRLRVKDGAAAGDYTIGLDYSRANTINRDGSSVALRTSGGTVTVLSNGTSSGAGQSQGSTTVQPSEDEEKSLFRDVAGNWAEEYILKAGERGLVNGKSEGIFDPNANMTRAEFMTILWRAVGSPAPRGKASFSDLPMAWYQEPIAWAEENNITNGTSPTTFDPNGNVTREQMMTILHRMAGKPIGMESMFTAVYDQQLADSASISSWAKDAVYWSIFHEILCGEQSVKLGNTVAPKAAATRSQIAVSIIRYLDR